MNRRGFFAATVGALLAPLLPKEIFSPLTSTRTKVYTVTMTNHIGTSCPVSFDELDLGLIRESKYSHIQFVDRLKRGMA